jgi:hypothetical protein
MGLTMAAQAQVQGQAGARVDAQGAGAFATGGGVGGGAVGGSDHDRFVGSFALGYMGSSLIPFVGDAVVGTDPATFPGTVAVMNVTPAAVYAPAVGMRYWFTDMFGLDVGLGFRSYSGTVKYKVADPNPPGAAAPVVVTYEQDKVNQLGFLLHAGVPIALSAEDHYVFELVPEANIGFASGKIKDKPYVTPGTVPPPAQGDIKLSGFRFDIGLRAGAEIHFGFMDIPNLALQAGIGLYFSMERFKADGGSLPDPANPALSRPNTTYQDSSTTISTSVNNDPWAIFTNNISALYYF